VSTEISAPVCGPHPCTPRIQLFGSFRLTVDGVTAPVPLGVQRLLAVLALRERMSRARAAGVLWPEAVQLQAQANLRKVCWRLPAAVPGHELVQCVGHELQLHPGVSSDVGELTAAVHRRGAVGPGRGLRPHLPRAGLLRDLARPEAVDLLPEWDAPWLDDERERLRQLRLHALEEWSARLAEQGDYTLALEVALTVLASDPLRESAHRAVIRVHLAEGNVQEARRTLASCAAVLDREIGVAPSEQTVALVP
jgi:DNA-binding SARP family transcriptional activator